MLSVWFESLPTGNVRMNLECDDIRTNLCVGIIFDPNGPHSIVGYIKNAYLCHDYVTELAYFYINERCLSNLHLNAYAG